MLMKSDWFLLQAVSLSDADLVIKIVELWKCHQTRKTYNNVKVCFFDWRAETDFRMEH